MDEMIPVEYAGGAFGSMFWRWASGNEPARHRSAALGTRLCSEGPAAGSDPVAPHRETEIIILASQDCHEDAIR